ncbi:MAG: hypothetical protein LH465_05570 [Sphingomonas bacterium]|nr:hypothetical protein [Sphingomonas bacterium]
MKNARLTKASAATLVPCAKLARRPNSRWEIPPHAALCFQIIVGFPGLFAIGTTLEMNRAWIDAVARPIRQKGRRQMFSHKVQQRLFAAFASLLMSSIAVGAAIAPAHVAASTVEVVTYA